MQDIFSEEKAMTVFGIRDLLAPHACPRCRSKATERIGRNSNGERIIHCEKCQYYGVVKPSADLRDSYRAGYLDGESRKSNEGE